MNIEKVGDSFAVDAGMPGELFGSAAAGVWELMRNGQASALCKTCVGKHAGEPIGQLEDRL